MPGASDSLWRSEIKISLVILFLFLSASHSCCMSQTIVSLRLEEHESYYKKLIDKLDLSWLSA